MTRAKQMISLLVALAMLLSCTLLALSRSRAATDCSNQKPMPTVLNEIASTYSSVGDIEDEETRSAYAFLIFFAIYYAMPMNGETPAEAFRNEEQKAAGLIELLSQDFENQDTESREAGEALIESLKTMLTGDFFRNNLIWTYFFQVGGAAGLYQVMFPESLKLYEDAFNNLTTASAAISGKTEDGIAQTIAQNKVQYANAALAQYFSRTLDVKEFLERVIAYYGPQKTRLSGEPTLVKNNLVDSVVGTGFSAKFLNDFEDGTSFYDILDRMFETNYASFYGLKDEDMDANKEGFAELLQEIYDYMYPECMIVPDTTTTTTIVVPSTNYMNIFDITGISQIRNMTNVTNLTNVTGATRVTNVTSYGQITGISSMYY